LELEKDHQMNELGGYTIAAWVLVALFILVPMVLVGRLAIGIFLAWLSHRSDEKRKVTRVVPNLGSFESTNDHLWIGYVNDIQVFLTTQGGLPTQTQADQVRAVLTALPRLSELSRAYLKAHEDCSWLEGGATGFEPESLEFESSSAFVLTFGHPSDDDGSYRVSFESGMPVETARDD
jgi:hypothetical protein